MKILYYNWDEIDGHIGGGVTVYQRNLLSELIKRKDLELYFINSGYKYDDKGLRIERTTNSFGEAVLSYEIINSPVLAPVQESCKNLSVYLSDQELYGLFKSFIIEHGKFDVIHFNNLEGLSLKVFELHKIFTNTKFIYSVHNYFPVCSRVNLWKDERSGDGHNCDKKSFLECVKCYSKHKYMSQIVRRRVEKSNKIIRKTLHIVAKVVENILPDSENVDVYRKFEIETIASINDNIDLVIAVSNRVKEILENHGIEDNKIKVSYIGTRVADNVLNKCANNPFSDIFTIAYMGYMNKEKGFFFLLDALEKIPDDIAKCISIRVIARYNKRKNKSEINRLNRLKTKFNNIELFNGYTPKNQRELLENVNLGVIPVLWEDNLPQVAIEQIAYGIPVLVSDLGGAKEVAIDPNFIFHAGNLEDFISRILAIQCNRYLLVNFWKENRHLVTMQEHIDELLTIYCKK